MNSMMDDTEMDWVYLVTPFVCCLTRPAAICLGFEKLMERMGESIGAHPARKIGTGANGRIIPAIAV